MTEQLKSQAVFHEKLILKTQKNKDAVSKGVLTVVGIIICFIPFGWLLGIPMIIASFFAGTKKGDIGLYAGKCPKCQHAILVPKNSIGFDCPICKTRLVRYGTEFSTV